MFCPRLDHFVRLNPNGTVSRCGHMINPPQFSTLDELDASIWLETIKQIDWPAECERCQQTEMISNSSIRLDSIKRHTALKLIHSDYLIVGGVLDNICNSACQMCSEHCSTMIGGLKNKDYVIYDNTNHFWSLPQERIIQLDINGGEPSASKNYKQILANLPPNVRSIRVNTNCSSVIEELTDIIKNGVKVTVTVSFDGIGPVHDYIRWPITWKKFEQNLMTYKTMPVELDLWTTVNALNINQFEEILNFVNLHNFNHSYGLLNYPNELNVNYTNDLTIKAKQQLAQSLDPVIKNLSEQVAISSNNNSDLWKYVNSQDQLRNIKFIDYYG